MALSRQPEFESLEASEIFCPRCKASKPVRSRLLLVLPTGHKYEYLCAECGASVGSKMDNDASDFSLAWAGPAGRATPAARRRLGSGRR